LLLASSVGAYWIFSREFNRPRLRRAKVPLFEGRENRDGEYECESDELWEEKNLSSDDEALESDSESLVKKVRKNESVDSFPEGEGCPPAATPPPLKSRKVIDNPNMDKDQEVLELEENSKGDVKDQETPKSHDPRRPVRKLLIRTPTHTTEIIRIQRAQSAQARRDSDMFFNLLSLYSKESSEQQDKAQMPSNENDRSSVMLCRESLDHDRSDEGDPIQASVVSCPNVARSQSHDGMKPRRALFNHSAR